MYSVRDLRRGKHNALDVKPQRRQKLASTGFPAFKKRFIVSNVSPAKLQLQGDVSIRLPCSYQRPAGTVQSLTNSLVQVMNMCRLSHLSSVPQAFYQPAKTDRFSTSCFRPFRRFSQASILFICTEYSDAFSNILCSILKYCGFFLMSKAYT